MVPISQSAWSPARFACPRRETHLGWPSPAAAKGSPASSQPTGRHSREPSPPGPAVGRCHRGLTRAPGGGRVKTNLTFPAVCDWRFRFSFAGWVKVLTWGEANDRASSSRRVTGAQNAAYLTAFVTETRRKASHQLSTGRQFSSGGQRHRKAQVTALETPLAPLTPGLLRVIRSL